MTSPDRSQGSALRRLTGKRKATGNLYLRDAGSTTLFGAGDEVVTRDVELVHDLDLAPTPARRPTSPPEVLLVTMECSIEDMNGTVLHDLVNNVVNVGDADRKELACQTLTKKLMGSASATIMMAEKPCGASYGSKISASKGGVVVDADGIKFAAIFTGLALPNKATFDRIFKVGNRTLLEIASREEGFLKLMVWPRGGANYVISPNPNKVCAIPRSRKLCKLSA